MSFTPQNNINNLASMIYYMPGLVFAKDTASGCYIACNQAYAEYVHKDNPEAVIGLTDFDLHDAASAVAFLSHDRETLAMDEPNVYYEDILTVDGQKRRLQTTKMKYVDEQDRLCIMGMCVDVTAALGKIKENILMMDAFEKAKSASLTYSRIARALAADYVSIYSVNVVTGQYIEFSSQTGRERISFERKGTDFFSESERYARNILYPEDQEMFIEAFTKDRILRTLDTQGTFSLSCRLMVDGEPTFVNIKVVRMSDDENHIIIGVSNVDSQMKERETVERIKEERITYSRVAALAGDYLCIYTVDPKTDHYREYGATPDYECLDLSKEGDDFFVHAREESLRTVYSKDVGYFNRMFRKDRVLREIERNRVFVIRYRMVMNGAPVYVSLHAAMVEEKDGPQIIVGVSNIDEQVKREQEYANDLSQARAKAMIDALTGVKNKLAYAEAEDEMNRQVGENGETEFAIVVCDVNGLKEVNDTQGHNAGDQLLRNACLIICDVFKHSPVFRIGGDEFVVIAQGRDYRNIDRLMAKLNERNEENRKAGGIVIACGMAKHENESIMEDVFIKADQLMYENKRELKERGAA